MKIPVTEAGLKAAYQLTREGIKTNVTLIFTEAKGLRATKVDATYISPFIGRLDDMGADGIGLVQNLKAILETYGYETEITAASIHNLDHIVYYEGLEKDLAKKI